MAEALPREAGIPDFDTLKERQRALRETLPEDLNLRVHRAISWLGRAEQVEGDADLRFILLWVGFNAAYARGLDAPRKGNERDAFEDYFEALVALDPAHRIYNAVWERFPHEIKALLNNKYVFAPFWNFHNGEPDYRDWETRLRKAKSAIAYAISRRNTPRILSILFDRLYVLRNQLLHGGATWNSGVNRDQVNNGAALIGWLLPVFIDTMLDHPDRDWGRPHYPVVE